MIGSDSPSDLTGCRLRSWIRSCPPLGILLAQAQAAFTAQFGGEPAVLACAPGRVELLGNHTDYNGGLVMAAAIDRSTVVVGRRAAGTRGEGLLGQFRPDRHFLARRHRADSEAGAWTRYVRGVCWALTAVVRPARLGLRGADRRRRSARGRALELGQPPGIGRLVSDPARTRSRPVAPRLRRGSGRPAPHGAGQGAAAVGERVRRRRLGLARPVLQPVRPCRTMRCSSIATR